MFCDISNMVSYYPCRLKDTLTQKIDASGYRENAPENIQEQDMKNLTSLSGKLDAMVIMRLNWIPYVLTSIMIHPSLGRLVLSARWSPGQT